MVLIVVIDVLAVGILAALVWSKWEASPLISDEVHRWDTIIRPFRSGRQGILSTEIWP